MKNISLILLSAFFVFSFNTTKAGNKEDKHEKVGGIRAGWQYSGLYQNGSIQDGYDPMSAFYVGIFKDVKIIPLLRFGIGLEYSQVGLTSSDANIDNAYKLSYLYLPLYLKVKVGPVFALGGVSPSFKVGEKITVAGQSIGLTDNNKANVFDIPVFLGAGLKILFVSVEVRYNWGMLNVYEDPNAKSQYLQVGAAISF
jgi:hypothetical protein